MMKCKHKKKCGFYRAFGYCIKQIGEECTFYPKEGETNGTNKSR